MYYCLHSANLRGQYVRGSPVLIVQRSVCVYYLLSCCLFEDDDHWIVDTDYDNYAIHYACRQVDYDGTCLDSYSFIFSRHPTGLRAEDQMIVTQKKQHLCLLGKYRRVAHNGEGLITSYADHATQKGNTS